MNNVFKARFASWQMILALSPRELAYEIAIGMNLKDPNGTVNWHLDGIAQSIAGAYANTKENRLIIMEGLQELFTLGLMTASGTPADPYVYLSRAGRKILSQEDARSHRAVTQEAYKMLDSTIVKSVWTPYLRGDFDIAIAYAFKRVEVEMRSKGSYGADLFTERLIKRFFSDFRLSGSTEGPKPATSTAEEQFFIGTSSLYRNPASHQDQTITEYDRAMEVLLIANHQLLLVRESIRR